MAGLLVVVIIAAPMVMITTWTVWPELTKQDRSVLISLATWGVSALTVTVVFVALASIALRLSKGATQNN